MSEPAQTERAAIADFMSAVNALRDSVDRNAQHDVVLDEQIARINAALDKFEPMNAKLTEAADLARTTDERLQDIEKRLNRPGAVVLDEAEQKAAGRKAAFREFLMRGDQRMAPERKAALIISDDTSGGYLSTPEYVREIIKAIVLYSPMRDLCTVRTTANKSIQIPKRTGVYSGGWVGEVEPRTEATGQAYGMEEIPVHEQWIEVYVSMANLEDSEFDIEAEVRNDASEQFGVLEGQALISGNGVKKPQGFLDAGAGMPTYKSGNATGITADSLIQMKYDTMKTAYAVNGTYVMNRKTLGVIRTMKDGEGSYLWMPGLAMGRPNTIDGDPYREMPDMPNIGAGTVPVAFGDWRRAYIVVDRLALAVTRDDLTLASQGKVKFIMRRRLGGQVVLSEALIGLLVST
jgi:HK97 family phage major capsid protein